MSKIIDLIGPPDLDTEFDPLRDIPRRNVGRSGANLWVSQTVPLPTQLMRRYAAAFRTLRRSKWWPLFRTLFRPLFLRLCDLSVKIQKASKKPGTVEISDADRLRIRSICHKSNELLATHLNRNLVDLGY
jgi:hypothetical protein